MMTASPSDRSNVGRRADGLCEGIKWKRHGTGSGQGLCSLFHGEKCGGV